MPPKGKKQPILIEGQDTTEMNFPQLQQYMILVYEKLLKEREERSYFQMERDKLRTYWELARNQLEEARAQIRNKDYALELAEERRQSDLNEVNQKVRYLIYEQNLQLNEASIRERDTLLLADKHHMEQELELLSDKKDLKASLKAMEENHIEENKMVRIQHAEEKSTMRRNFEKETEELVHKVDKRITFLKIQLENTHKLEFNEIEERKNTQIKTLTENHKQSFDDIRNYYNNITLNNFSLITNLKDNIEEMKRKDAVKDKNLKEVLKENRTLEDEVTRGRAEKLNLKHQLANYKKKTLKIMSMKREMNKAKAALDKLKWDYEILNLRFENNKNEKLKSDSERLTQASELHKEVGGRIYYLEEKIKAVKGQVERRETLINDFRMALQNAKFMGDKSPAVKELNSVLAAYDDIRVRRMTHRQSLFM